jgi:hypothetical protein
MSEICWIGFCAWISLLRVRIKSRIWTLGSWDFCVRKLSFRDWLSALSIFKVHGWAMIGSPGKVDHMAHYYVPKCCFLLFQMAKIKERKIMPDLVTLPPNGTWLLAACKRGFRAPASMMRWRCHDPRNHALSIVSEARTLIWPKIHAARWDVKCKY